ncbi:MAG TPA: serine O-acetyltransferase EpsC [Thermoanaerobaculaceae bacterium]|nr:serine O-acetyltransferase EpsC [Thermoanaerobaculaceae bacterium]
MAKNPFTARIVRAIETITRRVEERGEPLFHGGEEPLPQKREVITIVRGLQEVIYPGYFGDQSLYREYLHGHLGDQLFALSRKLEAEVGFALATNCGRRGGGPALKAGEVVTAFLERLPDVMDLIAADVEAAYEGDPAATCLEEVILAYPGVKAVFTYRIAHLLHGLGVPLIPRIMTEFAHNETGVDIHPGARIGREFFIDHGTGVVIGETTHIGDRVKLYQGVTLGALSFPRDVRGELVRGTKRHPTLEDDVVVYAGATILGGDTVVGRGSVIGGNVWLTTSVPPGSKVTLSRDQIGYEITSRDPEGAR